MLEELLAHLDGVILDVLKAVDVVLRVEVHRLGRNDGDYHLLVAPERVLAEYVVGQGDGQARGHFNVHATRYLQMTGSGNYRDTSTPLHCCSPPALPDYWPGPD